MDNLIGAALARFETGLLQFRTALEPYPDFTTLVFQDSEDWSDLLTYKLVPHLAGAGCLVAAFAGGTNTGKSTVYNLLLGQTVSPVVNTAAATCHPVLAANATRYQQCLEGKLVPEFRPLPLEDKTGPISRDAPENTLFVSRVESLPDHLVVMDTPDVDSIDKQNWEVAEHIRAAGDVLVAVVTAEKYKDERVVAFFREAVAAGRVVIPLMNKANPERDYAVARKQLQEFQQDVGTDAPAFIVPHDFDLAENLNAPIEALDGGPELRAYLEQFDVQHVKERVFSGTVRHFAERAGAFLDRVSEIDSRLRQTAAEFDDRASRFAVRYDPVPGKAIGGLFHEYVQSRRGPVRRAIGNTSAAVVRATSAVSRSITAAFRKRAALEDHQEEVMENITEAHRRMIERIVQDLATNYIEQSRNLDPPLANLLLNACENLDRDTMVDSVVKQTLRSDDISDEFREHARRTLDTWWKDHKGKRRVLESLDIMLAVMPAAIAAPIAMHTGGVGAPEAVVAISPFAAQFVTRVMEFQFGDAMFDFLSPWKKEQQEHLLHALSEHVTQPCLAPLKGLLEAFSGETLAELRSCQQQCLKA